MKRVIIIIIFILSSLINTYGQLSFVIDSLFLYTIEDVPKDCLNGGLDFYDNIQQYGPYVEVYGKVINLGQKDTTTQYYHTKNDGNTEILKTTEYYISFRIGHRYYKTRYYYDSIYDVPYLWTKRIEHEDVIYDTISPGETALCYFCSHFLFESSLFPKKKTDWKMKYRQQKQLAKKAKEAVKNGLEVSVEVIEYPVQDN